jgi:hypothetical protein
MYKVGRYCVYCDAYTLQSSCLSPDGRARMACLGFGIIMVPKKLEWVGW